MTKKGANSGLSALSKREAEALQWLAKGKTNLGIGLVLGISVKTVEKHLERVYRKLGVENRTMAAIALQTGNYRSYVWDCLHTREKTDIEGCLNIRTTASGACKECGLGLEAERGS